MRKASFYAFYLFCFAVLPGCNRHTGKPEQVKPRISHTIDTLALTKEYCFAGCAEYDMVLAYPNHATLHRKANMENPGHFHRTFSAAEADTLWKLVESAGLWEMRDEYHFNAEDSQARILTITGKQGKKTIRFRMMMPHTLTGLEKHLDQWAERDDWLTGKGE